MNVTVVMIKEILHIVEEIVEDRTTERVFFGYDDDGKLTDAGKEAFEKIGDLLEEERKRSEQYGDF